MRCTRRAAAGAVAADYKMEGRGEALHIACAVIAAIVRFSMKVRRIKEFISSELCSHSYQVNESRVN